MVSSSKQVRLHRMAVNFSTCSSLLRRRTDLSRCKTVTHASRSYPSDSLDTETDVVIIGSGVGGLSCGALLAKYGLETTVLEAHSIPGGCAHGWSRGDYHFDSGTSLFFGISNRDLENPLTSVLAILEEEVEMIPYGIDKTRLFWDDAVYNTQIGSKEFASVVEELWGHEARREWTALQSTCQEYGSIATSIHPMAVRYDNWIALTAIARSPLTFLKFISDGSNMSEANFSSVVNNVVHSQKLKDFVNILCQGTSGLGSDDILSSYMIRAFNRLYQPNAQWEIPYGGSQSIVDALVRGLRKHQGKLCLKSRVDRIDVENNRAVGVTLTNGKRLRARKAIVSNATVWDTSKLILSDAMLTDFKDHVAEMEMNASFMHLHLVFEGAGLPDLPLHSFFFDDDLSGDSGWPTICIPTAVDDSLAPPDKHILHAYLAEPYSLWKDISPKGDIYKDMKEERSRILWKLVKRVVPDIDDRVVLSLSGSPLTHERFLNRVQGTYGTKNLLKIKTTPTGIQPLENVFCVGDTTFPGTGTPAVAASAMWVANTLAPVYKHWSVLDALEV